MPSNRIRPIAIRLLMLLGIAASSQARAARYWAMLCDGTQLTAEELPHWDSMGRAISFAGRNPFDAGNHVRVVCDTTATLHRATRRVQMTNGDVIPGIVVGYIPEQPGSGAPAWLEVRPSGQLSAGDDSRLLIRADSVARISTGEATSVANADSMLVLRDGQVLRYRAIRWLPDGLSLLLQDERMQVAWSEIADLQIPPQDPSSAVLDTWRHPALDDTVWIGRLTTGEGTVISFPRALMRDRWVNNWRGGRVYVHQVQPAWSAKPVDVPFDAICMRSYWRRNEIPLSLLGAETVDATPALHDMPWQRDRNVLGGALHAGGLRADSGFGVHAPNEIALTLPPQAERFFCYVGLDHETLGGGCVRCRILRDQPNGEILWQSEFLRGGDDPQKVGPISVRGAERLVLQTDMAHQARPKDADPLDIRDHLDWLLPYVQIADADEDGQEFRLRQLAGWDQWDRIPPTAVDLALSEPAWNQTRQMWINRLRPVAAPLVLQRRLAVSQDRNCVNLMLAPEKRLRLEDVALAVDGEETPAILHSVAQDDIRLYWDLQRFEGQTVNLQLMVRVTNDTGNLGWLGCGVGAADRFLPGLPHTPQTAEFWRRVEARLKERPERRHELRKAFLQKTRYDQRTSWMGEFFAAEQEQGTPHAIEYMEALIRECELPDDALAHFRTEVVHSFIQRWLLLGPFDFDEGRAFEASLPPEMDEVDLQQAYDGLHGPEFWKAYRSGERKVSMLRAFQHDLDKPGLGYAVCWLRCDQTRRIKLGLGADDRIKVWLNRELVFIDGENHGASPRQFSASAELREGWNELLIKLDSHYGEWEFYCEVLDPELNRLPNDLKIRTTPPEDPSEAGGDSNPLPRKTGTP